MWRKRAAYKEKETEKYNEWKSDVEELGFPIYILQGDFFWIRETVDRMGVTLGRKPERVDRDLKRYTERMKYRSLARKKHFIWYESVHNNIGKDDMQAIKDYMSEPSDHGVLLISLKDRSEKFHFLKSFRNIRQSRRVKMYEMDYVSNVFKTLFIQERFREEGFEFVSSKLRKDTIRNLALNMDDFEDNVLTLISLEKVEFTKEDIKESIEEYSDVNTRKLYDSLVKLDRKNVPHVVLNELLYEGVTPVQIMRGIQRHFKYIYQAKYLTLRGITRANDIEQDTKKIYEGAGLLFNGDTIWDLTQGRRSRYLRDSEYISIKEIVKVDRIINRNIDRIVYREGDKLKSREIIDKEIVVRTVMDIMGRLDED